jgi:hypothetical protein
MDDFGGTISGTLTPAASAIRRRFKCKARQLGRQFAEAPQHAAAGGQVDGPAVAGVNVPRDVVGVDELVDSKRILEQLARQNVDLPAPFGPARTTTLGGASCEFIAQARRFTMASTHTGT